MRRLILMRHAKSDWSTAGLADHDRPLNPRGMASAKALGEWFRLKGYVPDEVISSSARRTGQTLMGLALTNDARTTFSRDLYLASAIRIRVVLDTAKGTTVLILGHNPGIADFAHSIVRTPPSHPRFHDYPTGATLVVDFKANTWSGAQRGAVIDFVVPRELTP